MLRKRFLTLLLIFALPQIAPASAATKYPKRIISLSPSATEDLFAIGAAKQVIAVDDLSNFPKSAPKTKLSAFSPNVEAIAKHQPDLVIIQSSATKSAAVVDQLKSLGIKVYVEDTPKNLTGAYSEIAQLGRITGQSKGASIVIDKMRSAISKTIAKAKLVKPLSFYHEVDNTFYSATSSTFIGTVYSDFNLSNIADSAAKADDNGYPQLQSEYIIQANPEYIFLDDGESASAILARPGWSKMNAVTKGKIVNLPADIPSRWGPRLINFYQFVAKSIR